MKTTIAFTRTLLLATASGSLLVAGCGIGAGTANNTHTPPVAVGSLAIQGRVFGGQQPVAGAMIRMYAVGNSGYGAASVPVLNSGVSVVSASDGTGSFSLTGKYTCSPEQRIYLTATGGNAGSGTNSSLAMMAALGRCGDLNGSTYININEVTTVASVWALSPFMSGAANIGASATNTTGINNAFADVATLATLATGTAGGSGLPAGTVVQTAAINTLADILASCINSNGGSSSTCPALFSAATISGVAPTDTLSAALNIAQHPGQSVGALFALTNANAPFQPMLPEAPQSFTLAATYSNANLAAPSAVAMDANGNAWIVDATTNKLTTLRNDGTVLYTVPGLNAPSAVAISQTGSAWIANSGNSTLTQVSAAGALAGTATGGGLTTPRSLGIDGQGNVWVVNGNSTLSEFAPTGSATSSSSGIAAPGAAIGISINPR